MRKTPPLLASQELVSELSGVSLSAITEFIAWKNIPTSNVGRNNYVSIDPMCDKIVDGLPEQLRPVPVEAAAMRLGVSTSKAYQLIKSGQLPAVKHGGLQYVSPIAIEDVREDMRRYIKLPALSARWKVSGPQMYRLRQRGDVPLERAYGATQVPMDWVRSQEHMARDWQTVAEAADRLGRTAAQVRDDAPELRTVCGRERVSREWVEWQLLPPEFRDALAVAQGAAPAD